MAPCELQAGLGLVVGAAVACVVLLTWRFL
jgi:hypothetical protein